MGQDIANGRRHSASEKTLVCNTLFSGQVDHLVVNQKFYRQRVMHDCLFLFADLFIALRFRVLGGLSFWTLAVHLVYLVVSLILIIDIVYLLVRGTNG